MKPSVAQQLWQQVEIFAGYGFNKAHAACYGLLAYQTAYLKANYPVEYMSAIMSAESHNTDKIVQAMEECRRMAIAVLPPSVNTSLVGFTIEDIADGPAIRFGLSAIKNVGVASIEVLLSARSATPFASLYELVRRVDLSKVNRKTLESLIKVGATSEFGTRAGQLAALDQLLAIAHDEHKQRGRGQIGLFESADDTTMRAPSLPDIAEIDKQELLRWEKELLGFYLTEHPLTGIMHTLSDKIDYRVSLITEELNGKKVAIGGIVENVRHTFTKVKNEEMAFVQLADDSGAIELVVFPKIFSKAKQLLFVGQPVVVHGKVDMREDRISLIIEAVYSITEAPPIQMVNKHLAITITIPQGTTRSSLFAAYELLRQFPGQQQVGFLIGNGDGESRLLQIPYQVTPSLGLRAGLEQLFGTGSVTIVPS